MKVAVIGGSVFLGINLIKELQKYNEINVVATYNKKKNTKKKIKRVVWKKLDIEKNKKNYFEYLDNPDIVINASWKDLPNYDSLSNYETLKFQKRFIENLVKNGLKNLVVLGTCFEYGLREGELKENFNVNPVTHYGNCKIRLYKFLRNLRKKNLFNLTWLRLFYIYGFNPYRMTLFNLIKKFNNNEIKSLNIAGNLERDYLSIETVAKIVIKLSLLKKNINIINLCSGKPIKLRNLVKKFIKNKSKFLKINFNSEINSKYEPEKFWGSIKKLNKYL